MILDVVTPPATEPITLTQAKDHLNLDSGYTAKDTRIGELIKMAREYAEKFTGRTLVSTVYDLKLDEWPCDDRIELPRRPVTAIASVSYYDQAGALQVLSASTYYFLALGVDDGRVVLRPSVWWPTLECGRPQAVIVRYTAGYGAYTAVPEAICHAIRLLVQDGFDAPGGSYVVGNIVTPLLLSADRLLTPYKQPSVLVAA